MYSNRKKISDWRDDRSFFFLSVQLHKIIKAINYQVLTLCAAVTCESVLQLPFDLSRQRFAAAQQQCSRSSFSRSSLGGLASWTFLPDAWGEIFYWGQCDSRRRTLRRNVGLNLSMTCLKMRFFWFLFCIRVEFDWFCANNSSTVNPHMAMRVLSIVTKKKCKYLHLLIIILLSPNV